LVKYCVFDRILELVNNGSQTVACSFAAILVTHVLECLLEKSVVGYIVHNASLVVETNPGLESIEYVFPIDFPTLESLRSILVEQMQDVELLLNEALLGCLPMQFVHHEFVVVDFACDELQSLVVNIVEFNVLWLVGHEAAQVVLDGA